MRTLMKVLAVIILVLSVSIMAQPQPGACAPACEYGTCDFYGEGIIATVGDGFLPATISFSYEDSYEDLFTGVMTIKAQNANKTFYDGPYTAYVDLVEYSLFMTTTGKATLLGKISPDGTQISLVLQIPGDGITGKFLIPLQN